MTSQNCRSSRKHTASKESKANRSSSNISSRNTATAIDPPIHNNIHEERRGYNSVTDRTNFEEKSKSTTTNSDVIPSLTNAMSQWRPYASRNHQQHHQQQYIVRPHATSTATREVISTPSIVRHYYSTSQGSTKFKPNYRGPPQTKNTLIQASKNISSSTTYRRDASHNFVHIVRSNFLTDMHAKCLVGYYKVHRYGCDCTKMKQLLSVLPPNNDQRMVGLMVIPETGIQHIRQVFYLCPTDDNNPSPLDIITDKNNRINLENQLRKHLFPPNHEKQHHHHYKKLPPYQVSCASCLLQLENNGFVCVASKSYSTIQSVIQLANQRKDEKLRRFSDDHIHHNTKSSIHVDHAFFLLGLPKRLLWDITTKKAKRFPTTQVMQLFLSQVQNRNKSNNYSSSDNYLDDLIKIYDEGEATTNTTFKVGPHLLSMLRMTNSARATAANRNQRYVHPSSEVKEKVDQEEEEWWLVMVENKPNLQNYHDKNIIWNLDLPGGKRHLGETSLQCAIRETEEETSLIVDESWTKGKLEEMNNTYYIMHPPTPQSF
jgi:hypothetical protein